MASSARANLKVRTIVRVATDVMIYVVWSRNHIGLWCLEVDSSDDPFSSIGSLDGSFEMREQPFQTCSERKETTVSMDQCPSIDHGRQTSTSVTTEPKDLLPYTAIRYDILIGCGLSLKVGATKTSNRIHGSLCPLETLLQLIIAKEAKNMQRYYKKQPCVLTAAR